MVTAAAAAPVRPSTGAAKVPIATVAATPANVIVPADSLVT